MNLKEYIKDINEFILVEEFDEENSNTMNDKVATLQDLLKRFQEFLQKIEGKTTLEEIQSAVGNAQGVAPDTDAQLPQPVQEQPGQA